MNLTTEAVDESDRWDPLDFRIGRVQENFGVYFDRRFRQRDESDEDNDEEEDEKIDEVSYKEEDETIEENMVMKMKNLM